MSIKFVPGKGWVTDSGFNVSAGSSDIAYRQQQRAKKDAARRSMYGQYDQYMGDNNLDWLKQNVGDSWWWSVGRLPNLAHDSSRFWKEMGGRSDDSYARNAEIVNRYRALEESGMSADDIQQAIWGGANLSPTVNNGGAGGGVTKPGMLSGGIKNQSNNQNNQQSTPPNNSIKPAQRQQRQGVWGSGFTKGGYGMLSEENENMRQSVVAALEKKLLG
jgi:hypothetical protein